MENYFKKAAEQIYCEAKNEGRLIEAKTLEALKEIALRQEGVIQTNLGSVAADSEPMSRSAPHTKNSVDHSFGEVEAQLAAQAVICMNDERVISIDTIIGDGRDGVTARFLMPEQFSQIAYGLKLLFEDTPAARVVDDPTYTIIFFADGAFELNKFRRLLEKDVMIRLWMGERRGDQVKICRNSTYLGEAKKGIFQFESWRVKKIDHQGLFLHCGARRDNLWVYDLETERPELRERITGVAGLTATGKTTTLCRKLAKLPRETSEMIGDDGGTLGYDGSYTAFEMGGVYIKTEGLNKDQPEILRAALSGDAFLENVAITKYPYMPDFMDTTKTGNGRAVIRRENLGLASRGLRANRMDYIVMLTRNPLANVISKLTPEQATMQFIYGESIESTGGNPDEAGTFKRVFFLDPFLTGDRLEHAMIFYEIVKRNRVKCYLANTGVIGEHQIKVSLRQSLATYSDMLRMQLRFESEPDHLGYHHPIKSDRANMDLMNACSMFHDHHLMTRIMKNFLRGRRRFLEEFEATWGKIPSHIRESLIYRLSDREDNVEKIAL